MDPIDASEIRSLQSEKLWHLATQWTPDQWRLYISSLSPDQIPAVLPAATEEQNPHHWKEKMRAIIEGLNTPLQLEAAGRVLSATQVNEVISWAASCREPPHAKLFPLFIGMPHQTFLQLLLKATPGQLSLLKQEGITEPVQHHLTLLAHELTAEVANCSMSLSSLEQEIENIDLSNIDLFQIETEEQKIKTQLAHCFSIQNTASKALAIAWNTNRMDIIEKLSKIKEQSQKFIGQIIGVPRSAASEPTGLFASFEKHLDSVFNTGNDTASLSNEEPVTEALVKFSVWYLRDYWEIGLLPEIKNLNFLELDPTAHTEKECNEYRENLFATAEQHLERLGLFTLCDLKQAKIYSKKALKDFILQNQSKLHSPQ